MIPALGLPSLNMEERKTVAMPNPLIRSRGDEAEEKIWHVKSALVRFRKELDDAHYAILKIGNHGFAAEMIVSRISHSEDGTISFYGEVNGEKSVLLLDVSQFERLSFLITAFAGQPDDPDRKFASIGFDADRG